MRRLALLPILAIVFAFACSEGTTPTSLDSVGDPQFSTSGGGQVKVEVCHRNTDGSYNLITIGEPAFDAHLAHGDAAPGELVPEMPGFRFDNDCLPVPAVPDQSNPGPPEGFSGCGQVPGFALYQSFTPTRNSLNGVSLYLRVLDVNQLVTVRIRSAAMDGIILGTTSVDAPPALADLYFGFTPPLGLTPGETYFIEYVDALETATWTWSYGDPYLGGASHGCDGTLWTDRELVFATY